jgi:hypothetical protein
MGVAVLGHQLKAISTHSAQAVAKLHQQMCIDTQSSCCSCVATCCGDDVMCRAAALAGCLLQADAFADVGTLKLLGGVLAPYCSMLEFTTRRMEMQRLVNEIITPIAAQLAQQKHSQLARLGCTVEEAPPGTVPTDGKGISVAVGGHSRSNGSSTGTGHVASYAHAAKGKPDPALQLPPLPGSMGEGLTRRGKGSGGKAAAAAGAGQGAAAKPLKSGNSSSMECEELYDGAAGSGSGQGKEAAAAAGISHKRFESGEQYISAAAIISRQCNSSAIHL